MIVIFPVTLSITTCHRRGVWPRHAAVATSSAQCQIWARLQRLQKLAWVRVTFSISIGAGNRVTFSVNHLQLPVSASDIIGSDEVR